VRENPTHEISSISDQRQKIKNNNSSFSEIVNPKEVLKIRGEDDQKGICNNLKKIVMIIFNELYSWMNEGKENSGSFGLPATDGFMPHDLPKNRQSNQKSSELAMVPKDRGEKEFKNFLNIRKIEKGKINCIVTITDPNLIKYREKTLLDERTKKDIYHLIDQCQLGNHNPGAGTD